MGLTIRTAGRERPCERPPAQLPAAGDSTTQEAVVRRLRRARRALRRWRRRRDLRPLGGLA